MFTRIVSRDGKYVVCRNLGIFGLVEYLDRNELNWWRTEYNVQNYCMFSSFDEALDAYNAWRDLRMLGKRKIKKVLSVF